MAGADTEGSLAGFRPAFVRGGGPIGRSAVPALLVVLILTLALTVSGTFHGAVHSDGYASATSNGYSGQDVGHPQDQLERGVDEGGVATCAPAPQAMRNVFEIKGGFDAGCGLVAPLEASLALGDRGATNLTAPFVEPAPKGNLLLRQLLGRSPPSR